MSFQINLTSNGKKPNLTKQIKENIELLRRIKLPTGEWLNEKHHEASAHACKALSLFKQSLK